MRVVRMRDGERERVMDGCRELSAMRNGTESTVFLLKDVFDCDWNVSRELCGFADW